MTEPLTGLTPLSDPASLEFELVERPGFTEAEAYAFLAGADTSTFGLSPITASAEIHIGAMIALVPSNADARRLAIDGFEDADQLHLTLVYLGDAADFDERARNRIIEIVDRHVRGPITARVFAVNVFNPNGDEPALVLGVGNAGDDNLERLHTGIYDDVRGADDFTVAENHTPWVPHVTLAYGNIAEIINTEMLSQAARRTGPVTFDRVRIAFGGKNYDVPLIS